MLDPELTDFLLRCGVPRGRLERLDLLEWLHRDLIEANRTMNLTRIAGDADFWRLHVADSLSVGLAAPELLREPLEAADVGCGAGFPLLPLAWANPALRITGIESRQRKAAFVARQIEALGLANCRVAAGRARELARTADHAGRYDVLLMRAVGLPSRMVAECRGLLKRQAGALMIFYETPGSIAEQSPLAAREARKFGLELSMSEPFALPGGEARQFLILTRPGGA